MKGRGSPRFNAISSRYKRRVVLVAALLASDFAPTVTLFAPDIALPGTSAAPVDVFRHPPRPQTFLARSTDTRLAFAQLREGRASRRSVFVRALPSGTVNATVPRQYTGRLASNIAAIDLGGALPIGGDGAGIPDLFGRLSASRAEARAQFAGAYLDYGAVRMSVAANVAGTCF